MSEKRRRQQALRQLIAEQALRSQADVVDALAGAGFVVHEATVSRDLADVGAIKVRTSGRAVYRLADDTLAAAPADHLDDTLQRFVTRIAASGNIVVLRTPPACAHPVASAIDGGGLPDVLATVAGDDTVLVIARARVAGHDLAQLFAGRTGLAVDE